MAVFSHSVQNKSLYRQWSESRRKITDGWILMSLGLVIPGLSALWLGKYWPIGVAFGGVVGIVAVFILLQNHNVWNAYIRDFPSSESISLFNLLVTNLSNLPVVMVCRNEYPVYEIGVFSATRSYVVTLSSSPAKQSVSAGIAEEMKRLLPHPWQNPVVFETITDPLSFEAQLHRIAEESRDNCITWTLLETVWRFSRVVQSFLILGKPLPVSLGLKNASPEERVKTQEMLGKFSTSQPSARVDDRKKTSSLQQNKSVRSRLSARITFSVLLLAAGLGLFCFLIRTGYIPKAEFIEEAEVWLVSNLPLEWSSRLGLGKIESNPETNITAETLDQVRLYDRVGGGQTLAVLPRGGKVDVVQEEFIDGSYWYYVRQDNYLGWAKDGALRFKHLLPPRTGLYSAPFAGGCEQVSPERPVPFFIERIYRYKDMEWWEIRGFSPSNLTGWIRRGDLK